jgi:HEAT repeat protein
MPFQRKLKARWSPLILGAMSLICVALLLPHAIEAISTEYYLRKLDDGKDGDDSSWIDAAEVLSKRGCVRALRKLVPRSSDEWRPEVYDSRGASQLSPMDFRPEYFANDAVEAILAAEPRAAVAELVALLSSEEPRVRRRAAGWLQGAGYLLLPWESRLRSALDDPDACVRVEVARALLEVAVPRELVDSVAVEGVAHDECAHAAGMLLREIGPPGAQAVTAMVATVSRARSQGQVEFVCEGNLSACGAMAVQALKPLLLHSNPNVREGTAEILGRIGTEAAGVAGDLARMLSDPAEEVRLAAIVALGAIKSRDVFVLNSLVGVLKRTGLEERQAAARSLGQIGSPGRGVEEALSEATRDENSEVRAAAAEGLGGLPGGASGALSLKKAAEDTNWGVRSAATKALVLREEAAEGVQDLLTRLSGDIDPATRAWALAGLMEPETSPPAPMMEALSSLLIRAPDAVCECVVHLGVRARALAPRLVESALNWGIGTHPYVNALQAVHPERSDLLPLVSALSSQKDVKKSDYGRDALRALGPAGAPVLEDLIGLLSHESTQVGLKTADCLSWIGPPATKAVPALKELYFKTTDRVTRYQAWQALSSILETWFRPEL